MGLKVGEKGREGEGGSRKTTRTKNKSVKTSKIMVIHNKRKQKEGTSLSLTPSLSLTVLITKLSTIQPLATTLLSDSHHATETFHRPHSSLYELLIGPTGFIFYSETLRKGLIGCAETSVRNYHYWPCNNPEEPTTQLLCVGSLKLPPIFCSPLRVLIQISYPQNTTNYCSIYIY
jgi:hypothetical protein